MQNLQDKAVLFFSLMKLSCGPKLKEQPVVPSDHADPNQAGIAPELKRKYSSHSPARPAACSCPLTKNITVPQEAGCLFMEI